jgi:two-component system, chemotaxis family, chemotaxis protein CheY
MAVVLVAEDDRDCRELVAEVVRQAGHEPMLAEHGGVADVFMPELDGIETIRVLRALQPDVKIIAMSAGWRLRGVDASGDDYEVLDDAKRAGAHVTVRKPFDVDHLRHQITGLLKTA